MLLFPQYFRAKNTVHNSVGCTLYCIAYLFSTPLSASRTAIFWFNLCWCCLTIKTWFLTSIALLPPPALVVWFHQYYWKLLALDMVLWQYCRSSWPVVNSSCGIDVPVDKVTGYFYSQILSWICLVCTKLCGFLYLFNWLEDTWPFWTSVC